ncbi:hypothetical protein LEMLEM_LOCUS18427 [Lemmus lemmus]
MPWPIDKRRGCNIQETIRETGSDLIAITTQAQNQPILDHALLLPSAGEGTADVSLGQGWAHRLSSRRGFSALSQASTIDFDGIFHSDYVPPNFVATAVRQKAAENISVLYGPSSSN